MLKWLNVHYRNVGIIGIFSSILIFSALIFLDVQTSIDIMGWIFGIYLLIFSLLHTIKGFERSAGFMIWGFAMIVSIAIGVWLSLTTEINGAQNFVIVPLVIFQTTGVFRRWADKVKVQAGLTLADKTLTKDEVPEDFPFPQRFLVHSFIVQMNNLMRYPPEHVKNTDPDKMKLRVVVFLGSTLLLLGYLVFLALEIQIPGLTESTILILLTVFIYSFIFGLWFYILGFRYALGFTAVATILIPLAYLLFQSLEFTFQQSELNFWAALISISVIIIVSAFLLLRTLFRNFYNHTTIYRRKSKYVAFAESIPALKPEGHTAFTVSLKLKEDKNMFGEIMQYRPADIHAFRHGRWALAGITLDEDACEASYLIYAHPLAQASIERYFKHWDIRSVSIEACDDPRYEKFRSILPTLDEYFSAFNAKALVFFNVYEDSVNGSAPVYFYMAFSEADQMDLVEPLFAQEHLTVVERHEPVIDEDGELIYGGFVLQGEIESNIGMATQTTKRIIDLITPYGGELFRWEKVK